MKTTKILTLSTLSAMAILLSGASLSIAAPSADTIGASNSHQKGEQKGEQKDDKQEDKKDEQKADQKSEQKGEQKGNESKPEHRPGQKGQQDGKGSYDKGGQKGRGFSRLR